MRTTMRIMLLFVISSIALSACGIVNREEKKETDEELKSFCANYSSEYEVLEGGENGASQISIDAPDFRRIIRSILDEEGVQDISVNDIEEAAKKHPEYTKKYVFLTDAENEDEIEKRFLEEVSKDLIIEAIENTEIREKWSEEE